MPDVSTIGAVLNLFGAGSKSGTKVPLTTDKTLSLADRAADAQKVGEALDKKADKIHENLLTGSASGTAISVEDAFAAPMLGLHVYGKSTQDSTPTPTVPVPITIANQNNLIGFAYAQKGSSTLDEFKAFLDAKEVYVWTSIATPVETALSSAEIAAYKAMTTYAPTTVISVSDGAGATATYQRDVNIVVKNLEDAIASMTQN